MNARTHRLRTAARQLQEGLIDLWCGWTHGGGYILRDPLGRINWQCCKCGRWNDPVPLADEAAMTNAAIKNRTPGGCTDEG